MGTLNDLLSTVTPQEGSPVSQEELLANLVRQNMTQGLGVNSDIGGHQGQLTFSGPVAGYSGALRPSDVPDMKAAADIPVIYGGKQGMRISPGTEMARVEAGGPFRGVLPDAQAQQLSQGLAASEGQYPAGSQAKVAEGILQKYGLVEDPTTKLMKQLAVRDMFKQDTPLGANASKYINAETGQRATPDMSIGDVTGKGAKFLSLDSPQGKQYEALLNLRAHILAVAPYLKDLPPSTSLLTGGRKGNSLAMWMASNSGNTNAAILSQQLEAMTPIATARTFLGSGGRAGPAAAKMLHESNVSTSDDQQSGGQKIVTLAKVATELARDNGLPTAMFKDLIKEAGIKVDAKGNYAGFDNGSASAPTSPAAPSTEKTVTVSSPEEASKLPSGTLFTTPDGQTRRKR